jgi:hypothetical protein
MESRAQHHRCRIISSHDKVGHNLHTHKCQRPHQGRGLGAGHWHMHTRWMVTFGLTEAEDEEQAHTLPNRSISALWRKIVIERLPPGLGLSCEY